MPELNQQSELKFVTITRLVGPAFEKITIFIMSFLDLNDYNKKMFMCYKLLNLHLLLLFLMLLRFPLIATGILQVLSKVNTAGYSPCQDLPGCLVQAPQEEFSLAKTLTVPENDAQF